MHECFPKHLRMGTARMKYDREREEDKKRCVSMERSIYKACTKNEVPKAKTTAQAYLPPGSLFPKTVYEYPN